VTLQFHHQTHNLYGPGQGADWARDGRALEGDSRRIFSKARHLTSAGKGLSSNGEHGRSRTPLP